MLMSLVKANIIRKLLRKQQNEYLSVQQMKLTLASFNELLSDILFCICMFIRGSASVFFHALPQYIMKYTN